MIFLSWVACGMIDMHRMMLSFCVKKCYLQYVTKSAGGLSIPSPIVPTGMIVTIYRVYGSRLVSLMDCVEFSVLVLLSILVIFQPYLPYFIL